MAAHCLARYRFRLNRVIYFILFSTIIFPPQITIISLFQILVQYGLYNTKLGLTLVYVAIQLPLTIYILESFFARIPADLFDAARMDGYSDWEIFWRVTLPIALPAIATTVILNFILLWNEFLYAVVLITDEENRTLPLGIQRFIGDHAGGRRHDRDRPDDRDHPGDRRLRVLLREAHPGHDRRRGEVRAALNGGRDARQADQELRPGARAGGRCRVARRRATASSWSCSVRRAAARPRRCG